MDWYLKWMVFIIIASGLFISLFYGFPILFRYLKSIKRRVEFKPEAEVNIDEPVKRCPVCGKNMLTESLSGIIVDRCPMHGIWFDSGELESVVNYIKSGGNADLFLG